jgi:hypothetical protein
MYSTAIILIYSSFHIIKNLIEFTDFFLKELLNL